eukprot:SM000819S22597  [mRNA]  locus=s819:22:1351:+ [translate_table: standard]
MRRPPQQRDSCGRQQRVGGARFSVQPFCRHLPEGGALACLTTAPDGSVSGGALRPSPPGLQARCRRCAADSATDCASTAAAPEHAAGLASALSQHQAVSLSAFAKPTAIVLAPRCALALWHLPRRAQPLCYGAGCQAMQEGRLLHLTFTTLYDYLQVRLCRPSAAASRPSHNCLIAEAGNARAQSTAEAQHWEHRVEVSGESRIQTSAIEELTAAAAELQLLRLVAEALQPLGRAAAFYLAAAVSDFYLPWAAMAEHKIQSERGPLELSLARVPKMLGLLRRAWAPDAFCISFKLETDESILLSKAARSRVHYGMHAVVANELTSRRERVVLVTASGDRLLERGTANDLEQPLVDAIAALHVASRA